MSSLHKIVQLPKRINAAQDESVLPARAEPLLPVLSDQSILLQCWEVLLLFMYYVLLQLFGTSSDFKWSNKLLTLILKEYKLGGFKLVFWVISRSRGAQFAFLCMSGAAAREKGFSPR